MKNTVGVIVARFQVAELTEGHKALIDYVLSKNHTLNVIFLGLAPTRATKNNPLDYASRQKMLEEAYPGKFIIQYIIDEPSDYNWSYHLDEMIANIAGDKKAVLYGSRDSFCRCYHGHYPVEEYIPKIICSGTEYRETVGQCVKSSRDWRLGCIYTTQNRYPTAYQTVDCIIFDDDSGEYIWMAKKKNENKLRFVGGFVSPSDNCLEDAVRREVLEETTLEISKPQYICSMKVNDWRYRSEEDKIITSLFSCKRIYGNPKAQDDIETLHRVNLIELLADDVVVEHRPLLRAVVDYYKNTVKVRKEIEVTR